MQAVSTLNLHFTSEWLFISGGWGSCSLHPLSHSPGICKGGWGDRVLNPPAIWLPIDCNDQPEHTLIAPHQLEILGCLMWISIKVIPVEHLALDFGQWNSQKHLPWFYHRCCGFPHFAPLGQWHCAASSPFSSLFWAYWEWFEWTLHIYLHAHILMKP